MNKKGQKSLSLVLLLLLNSLFASVYPYGWQGTGNMSASNLTAVWNFIKDKNPILERDDINYPDNFCQQLSENLNGLWDPAWNVVTVKYVDYNNLYDAVLYGYAFRDHWMWYNNYRVGSKTYSFVIWKDYNCDPKNWVQLSGLDMSFNQQQQRYININLNRLSSDQLDDVWARAKELIDYLSQQTPFLDSGLSVVMAKDNAKTTNIYSSICSVPGKHSQNWIYQLIIQDESPVGQQPVAVYLVFRTR